MILELVGHGDLYTYLKENKMLSEEKCVHLMDQLGSAIKTLHENKYVHRDLKLENILIFDKNDLILKIVDFGFAEIINPNYLASRSGTPGYIAPEVFKNIPYTEKGDMFSLGVILYSLVSG